MNMRITKLCEEYDFDECSVITNKFKIIFKMSSGCSISIHPWCWFYLGFRYTECTPHEILNCNLRRAIPIDTPGFMILVLHRYSAKNKNAAFTLPDLVLYLHNFLKPMEHTWKFKREVQLIVGIEECQPDLQSRMPHICITLEFLCTKSPGVPRLLFTYLPL